MPNAYDLYRRGRGRVIFTCEHASPRVPRPLRTTSKDREWLQTHWGFDIGAANVTRELARRTGSSAVLARFSRLVCDANRPVERPDWVRQELEGHVLGFNRDLDQRERSRRQRLYHAPYHAAIDRLVAQHKAPTAAPAPILVAVHSFAPVLGQSRRKMEVGVLYNRHHQRGRRLARVLTEQGWKVAHNAPYSGRDPEMIYSIERHGLKNDLPFLELELRQDLIDSAPRARRVGRQLAEALLALTQ